MTPSTSALNSELPPILYIAGKYRARSEWALIQNIRIAEAAALKLWGMGYGVICPHKNTSHFGGAADDQVWLLGDLAMVKKSDVVFCLDNWADSEGAFGEVEFAKSHNIPVLFAYEECEEWIGLFHSKGASK